LIHRFVRCLTFVHCALTAERLHHFMHLLITYSRDSAAAVYPPIVQLNQYLKKSISPEALIILDIVGVKWY